jgi:hypothetical protein
MFRASPHQYRLQLAQPLSISIGTAIASMLSIASIDSIWYTNKIVHISQQTKMSRGRYDRTLPLLDPNSSDPFAAARNRVLTDKTPAKRDGVLCMGRVRSSATTADLADYAILLLEHTPSSHRTRGNIRTKLKRHAGKILKCAGVVDETTTPRHSRPTTTDDPALQRRRLNEPTPPPASSLSEEAEDEAADRKTILATMKNPGEVKGRLDDVIGLEDLKEDLRTTVLERYQYVGLYDDYGTPPSILLYGPPGTGKTFFASCCAGEAKGCTFFNIPTGLFATKWHGKGGQMMRILLEEAPAQLRRAPTENDPVQRFECLQRVEVGLDRYN